MKEKRIIKTIRVNPDKCIGCRACELACSAFHAKPRYSSGNPARSRIRVVFDEINDIYFPIRSVVYTPAECAGRHAYELQGKQYPECAFCGNICPSRDYFYEPDSRLPLKCDMCETTPPLDEPVCVAVCRVDALVYEEREEEVEVPETVPDELEVGVEALASEYGIDKLLDAVARLTQKGD
ncbi:4Fe-4S binding protein [Deferrisoma palaeochoriense]